MRPQRFLAYVVELGGQDPAVGQIRAEGGDGDRDGDGDGPPCGVSVTGAGGEWRFGITGQLPDGAKHEGFADEPVHGPPVEPQDPGGNANGPEAWLAGLLARAGCPEVCGLERWSVREGTRADHSGVTVRFHNGARVFVRLLK
ncbi:hypothetical protein [Streptomyces yaizuensis]|uniref:Uncharacterized protein n=1 Tax=Streptomyces yaizuensis TaxID=2989713 RepID=A0ABQ5P3F0_9ACTN|nr:hypothetical protein [Streptomyces sp. YSPA8]GLF97136.1 hypothetical protein SYYSPA8_22585 [Streptomyces sp. YSPA8]